MADWQYGEGHLAMNAAENEILRVARRVQEKYGLTDRAVSLALLRAAKAESDPSQQDQNGLPSRNALVPA